MTVHTNVAMPMNIRTLLLHSETVAIMRSQRRRMSAGWVSLHANGIDAIKTNRLSSPQSELETQTREDVAIHYDWDARSPLGSLCRLGSAAARSSCSSCDARYGRSDRSVAEDR